MTGGSQRAHGRIHDVAVAIQCGGESRRMGGDKALLPFLDVSLVEWMRDLVTPLFAHVFLVARDPGPYAHFGVPVVVDALPVRGAAVGVYTAITASPVERVLCLACDMPFVTPEVLRALAEGSAGFDVFVPRHGPYFQPLCAVYLRNAGPVYRRFIDEGGFRVDEVFGSLKAGYLDMDAGGFGDPDDVFANLNTPEELGSARERALALVEARSASRLSSLEPDRVDSAGWRPDAAPGRSVSGLGERPRGGAVLAPHVVAFMERVAVPTVSFVGKKKSGKTTVLVGVIEELVRRGRRVAVLKHDVHGFDIDIPGTDSYRLREAGAVVAGISSPVLLALIHKLDAEPALEELVTRLGARVDIVITEGFKRGSAPKVEVSRHERSGSLVCGEDELVAVATDQAFDHLAVPRLPLDDFAGLADIVESAVIESWPGAASRVVPS